MKQAVIYTRFSPRPNAAECASCENQEARCRAHCVEYGYAVGQAFSDRNVSGGLLDRPGLSDALEALEPGWVLVVDSADRLARDLLVSLTIRHQVSERGATIECADGSPMATTPEGKLLANILAAFSAYERDRVRFRTSRGLKERQANGEWFGKPPIGWMRDPEDSKRLVRCEEEQRAIEYIRKKSSEGCSSTRIAILLNRALKNAPDHDKPPFSFCRGGPWTARTVSRILKRNS
jgi:site-specific DNA recombinase